MASEQPLRISTFFLATFHRHLAAYLAILPVILSACPPTNPNLAPIAPILAEERSRVAGIGTKIFLQAALHILRGAPSAGGNDSDNETPSISIEPEIWLDITAAVADLKWMQALYAELSGVEEECEIEIMYLRAEIRGAEKRLEGMRKTKEGGKGAEGEAGAGAGKKVHFEDNCPRRTG